MNNETINKFENLTGEKPVIVSLTNGNSERVIVRALPVRKLPEYLAKQDDEAALIELACDKPAGWADGLTLESHEQLLGAVEGMNNLPFFAWLRRKVQRAERLAPGSTGEQGKAMLSTLPSGSRNAQSGVA